MAPQLLRFYQTGSFPFPYSTNGEDTALTVCRHKGTPSLCFLTQTPGEDDFVFLDLNRPYPHEIGRFSSPVNHWRISGIAYEQPRNLLWATEGSGLPHENSDKIIAVDADTGILTDSLRVPLLDSHALAYNGMYFVRSDGKKLEMITRSGSIVASMDVAIGTNCRGLSAAPWTYIASDTASNRLVVITLFGQVAAVCNEPPGEPGGIEAVAFDNIRDFSRISQLPLQEGETPEENTPYHPDTPWDPEPWQLRHRVYLANQKDQTIYAGYLYRTENP